MAKNSDDKSAAEDPKAADAGTGEKSTGTVPITIVKSFHYTHSDTRQQEFIPVGTRDYPAAMTDDHFFMSHSDVPPPPRVPGGTRAYADAHIAATRRREMVKLALEQQAQEAAAKTVAEAEQSGALVQAEEAAHAEAAASADEAAQTAETGQAAREGRRPQNLPPRGRSTV